MGKTFGYANLLVRGVQLNTVFANVDQSVMMYMDGGTIAQPGAPCSDRQLYGYAIGDIVSQDPEKAYESVSSV